MLHMGSRYAILCRYSNIAEYADMNRSIDIATDDGQMDAHVFTPDSVQQALPAVVVLTDIGGLRPCFYERAQHIADAGYAVLLPNIYYRDAGGQIVPDGRSFRDEDIRPTLVDYASHLTPEAQHRDFDALLNAIDEQEEFASGPVAVSGYCMTGGFALRMAARHPERVAAAAAFHSARLANDDDPNSPVHIVDTIKARVYLGHADRDELLPPAQIARLDGALAAAGVHFTTELYAGAGHGYTAKDAPAYDASADTRHYKRLLDLLEETIG